MKYVYITYGCKPYAYEIRTHDGQARDFVATGFFARRKAKKVARIFNCGFKADELFSHDYMNPIQPFNRG